MASLTIEQWLQGMVDFNVPEVTLAVILENNGITAASVSANLTESQKELCLADLYMWLATSSSTTSAESESDGGWSRTKSAKNVTNRSWYRTEAQRLYAKWSSSKASATTPGSAMKDLY